MSQDRDASHLDRLSPAKRALLEKRLRGDATATVLPPIEPLGAADARVLSFGQERLWYLQRLHPDSVAYNVHATLRLTGPVAVERFRSCTEQVLRGHEILRTAFPDVAGVPELRIAKAESIRVGLEALDGVAPNDREAAVQARARNQACAPFDMAHAPLLRAQVLRVTEVDTRLVLTLHHVVADEWSLALIWREISEKYADSAADSIVSKPKSTLGYADFAAWQRRRTNDDTFAQQFRFWREQLVDLPSAMQLPSDFSRSSNESQSGSIIAATLPQHVAETLRDIAREAGVSLFVVLLAAFKTLMLRYSGETDLVVGTPVTNRTRSELEQLLGFFVNTVPIRSDLGGNPSFLEVVDRVRVSTLAALANQDVPFERLVSEFAPRRELWTNPLFQVMFVMQRQDESIDFASGVTATAQVEGTGAAKFDLTAFVTDDGRALHTAIEYRDDVFGADTIASMIRHWQNLLAGIVEDRQTAIGSLPLIDKDERTALIDSSKGGRVEYPRTAGIHDLIRLQCSQRVDAPALITSNGVCSYVDLAHKADEITARLAAQGVKRGSLVGLHVERSIEMIAGLLGILQAGAAYVPLDPLYPVDRLITMIADSELQVVLTHSALAGALGIIDADIVFIDHDQDSVAAYPKTSPESAGGEDLAYVLYTSGSSGMPKGVAVSHRNLVHSTTARDHHYESAPRRFLLLSSFAFDSSLVGIFWTLCKGGTLVLAEPGVERDVARIAGAINQHRITHLLCLPSLYQLVLDYAADAVGLLDTVIVAGEACRAELVRRHFECAPNTRLYNEYGPTEGTVWSTVHSVSPDDQTGPVPIGRPIVNTRAIVLDPCREPVPRGVCGELYIGGDGVACGYLNRPELSCENFLTDTFDSTGTERLYRTGDLARVRQDGALEFLGREDRQFKLRGYRIEPEEIENEILAQPGIEAAVVDLRGVVSAKVGEMTETTGATIDDLLHRLEAMDPAVASALIEEIASQSEGASQSRDDSR